MNIPPELITFLVSMAPVLELRASIPLGISLGLTPEMALLISILGNGIVVIFLLKLLGPITQWLFRFPFLEERIKKYYDRVHHKHSAKFNTWGSIALVVFVLVPLPGSGAWTGSLIAYLFNMPFRLAFAAISAGVIIAGLIVTFASETILAFF